MLEAVVGFGLLSTALLLIFALFPTSHSTMAIAKDRSLAINLARDKCDELRNAGFNDPRNDTAGSPYTLGSIFLECTINGARTRTEFRRGYTVTTLTPSLKLITVEIFWFVGQAGASTDLRRSVTLETYVTSF